MKAPQIPARTKEEMKGGGPDGIGGEARGGLGPCPRHDVDLSQYLSGESDGLDGFEFLTMAEAGEVGH
jgi:hypothetical protein